jgi:hypothetical protein
VQDNQKQSQKQRHLVGRVASTAAAAVNDTAAAAAEYSKFFFRDYIGFILKNFPKHLHFARVPQNLRRTDRRGR